MAMRATDKGIDWDRVPREYQEDLGAYMMAVAKACPKGGVHETGNYWGQKFTEPMVTEAGALCLVCPRDRLLGGGSRWGEGPEKTLWAALSEALPDKRALIFEAQVRQ